MKTLRRPSQERATESVKEQQEVAAKQRGMVEKSIVWGGIGLLAIVVIIESQARLRYNRTLQPLEAAMESANTGHSVLREDVLPTVPGTPIHTTEKRFLSELDAYYWNFSSLFKSYRIKARFLKENNELTDLLTGDEALNPPN